VGNSVQSCTEDGSNFEAPVPCTEDEICRSGLCIAVVCVANTISCDGDTLIDCNEDGTDAIITECAATEMFCGVEDERAACRPRVCEPGAVRCDDEQGAVIRCDDRGSEEAIEPCGDDAYCQEGACQDRVCIPGSDPVCIDGDIQQCDDLGAAYVLVTACQPNEGCREGECLPLVCEPGSVRCVEDVVETCSEDGFEILRTSCQPQQGFCDPDLLTCVPWRCRPRSPARCEDNVVVQCDDRGINEDVVDACGEDELCLDAECRPLVCEPDTVACRGEVLETCDRLGIELTSEDCTQQRSYCDDDQGACLPWVCEPGSDPLCRDGDVQQCDGRGTGYELVQGCEDGQFCVDATCLDQVCEPRVVTCDGDVLQTCSDNGLALGERDCVDERAFCDPDRLRCTPWVCTPEDLGCIDGDVQACDARGTQYVHVEDCGERGCVDVACVRLEDGQACQADRECLSDHCAGEVCSPQGFVRVRAGSFLMGSPDDELGRFEEEGPVHRVTLSRALWFGQTEVTQAQWRAVMGTAPSTYPADDGPVESVSWFDALAYANARSEAEGLAGCYNLQGCGGTPGTDFTCALPIALDLDCQGYRLPTEAEWEYAARAATTTALYSGPITAIDCTLDPNLDAIGWYCGNEQFRPHPGGQKTANAWGLHDTSGNVFEWVWDWHDRGWYEDAGERDPVGPGRGTRRVVRGGSWNFFARSSRSAYRTSFSPNTRNGFTGIRLVRWAQ
jgi:formylglycine-generating enzyme required for sulfatase activity